jgi:hypothetical protein
MQSQQLARTKDDALELEQYLAASFKRSKEQE